MNGAKANLAGIRFAGFVCLTVGTLIAGCARHREFSGAEQRAMAIPPSFLTGPMALVLTNGNSFRAEIAFETMTTWGSTQRMTGSFTGAGSKLAFLPELSKSVARNAQAKMIFVWDTAQGSGYMLNDALQGYAPFSGTVRYTNLVESKQGSAREQIAGHECEKENAMVVGNDGSTNLLQVWRTMDLPGFAVRVEGGTNATANRLTMTKIQFGLPAEFLMSSEGFTKYDSPDAMVTELVARQHNLRKKEGEKITIYQAN